MYQSKRPYNKDYCKYKSSYSKSSYPRQVKLHSEFMENNPPAASSECYQKKKNPNSSTGECIHCHQKKPVKLGECYGCYQKKKNPPPQNIPTGECIHCHQKKPVKLGECYECYQKKKNPSPQNTSTGECIHCHQKKPVKLGECYECYKKKKNPPSQNIPTGECIHCHQEKTVKLGECYECYQKRNNRCYNNKKECPECKKRIRGMNGMVNDKICDSCCMKYQRRFENFNNPVMCKTCFKQDQCQNMYNENKNWFCSLDCMYAKKILNEIRKEKYVNKERISILLNRFTSTNKNAGLSYNLTPERIMKKLEKNMRLSMWI